MFQGFDLSILPLLAVLIPAVGAGIVAIISFYSPWWRNFAATVLTGATLFVIMLMYPAVVPGGKVLSFELLNIVSPLNLTFRVDSFSFLVALIASFV